MRNIPRNSKIAVAMSGGVDSSVAAALLVDKGYEVRGIFMEHLEDVEEQKNSALATADKLGIDLKVVDYREGFRSTVIDYFLDEYRKGRTPNPCVVCNKWIKFGKLLDYVKELGCDYLATGHYARLRREAPNFKFQITKGKEPAEGKARLWDRSLKPGFEKSAGRIKLLTARDKSKDQSYFLWQLNQSQLEHILFPIGDKRKVEIVKMAREKNLPVAERPESFEVCFVPESLEDFLRRQIPEAIKPGPVLDTEGELIGEHRGLPLYTYGQRRGFEVTKYQGIPQYVVGIDKERNALIVGRGAATEVGSFLVEDTNWISKLGSLLSCQFVEKVREEKNSEGDNPGLNPTQGWRNSEFSTNLEFNCKVRVRHQGELMDCTVKLRGEQKAGVVLDEPARAVTPGQSAVFYKGEEVLGGCVISHLGG